MRVQGTDQEQAGLAASDSSIIDISPDSEGLRPPPLREFAVLMWSCRACLSSVAGQEFSSIFSGLEGPRKPPARLLSSPSPPTSLAPTAHDNASFPSLYIATVFVRVVTRYAGQ